MQQPMVRFQLIWSRHRRRSVDVYSGSFSLSWIVVVDIDERLVSVDLPKFPDVDSVAASRYNFETYNLVFFLSLVSFWFCRDCFSFRLDERFTV